MKKTFIIITAVLLTVISANAQVLYRVTGNGLSKPSYIFGTNHLVGPSFLESVKGVYEAFDEVEQVYGEVLMADMENPDSLAAFQKKMALPDGKTLKEVLPRETYDHLYAFFYSRFGMMFDSPVFASSMGNMRPSVLVTQLSALLYVNQHRNEVNIADNLDGFFQLRAERKGKPVYGLETMEFQADVLVGQYSWEREVELLNCFLFNADDDLKMMEELMNAYRSKNVKRIKAAADKKRHDSCDSTPEEEKLMLDDRNIAWMPKMEAAMKEKPTFFAVGILHLLGDNGLVSMLTKAGYTVKGIK